MQQEYINYFQDKLPCTIESTSLNVVVAVLDCLKQCLPEILPGNREPTWVIRYTYVFSRRETSRKWRALTHMHAEDKTPYSSWSPPMLDKEYFQQGSWKQNLFAFLHSTFNFLLSFVSVGIFSYFIFFLLSPGERDFHLNSCSQGPAPMQGQKIIGQPIYPAVLFIFFPSSFPPWLWIDHGCCKMTAVSCALALQMKWKKKKWSFSVWSHKPAVWTGGERISILAKCCQDTVRRGAGDSVTWREQCCQSENAFLISSLITLLVSVATGIN